MAVHVDASKERVRQVEGLGDLVDNLTYTFSAVAMSVSALDFDFDSTATVVGEVGEESIIVDAWK